MHSKLLLTVLVLLFLVDGGCGELSITVGSGGSSGSGDAGLTMDTAIDSSVVARFQVNGGSVNPAAIITGPVKTFNNYHYVTDSNGNHAEVYAKVLGGNNIACSDDLKPGYGTLGITTGEVSATQWLSVGMADYIESYVSASNVKAINNKDGLIASVSAGVVGGSIDIQQSATAATDYKKGVDAWQKIRSASGDIILLNAKTSDISGKNKADSSVTAYNGALKSYNSEAAAAYLDLTKNYIDLGVTHGANQVGDDTTSQVGSIRGDWIYSGGSTTNQKGLTALYGVTLKGGSVEGIFDWGTETKTDDGWVIAVPLESPKAWYADPGTDPIKISASSISSNSLALKGIRVASQDWANANGVSVVKASWWDLPSDWAKIYGFAKPSEARIA